jgi:hypothetical protein
MISDREYLGDDVTTALISALKRMAEEKRFYYMAASLILTFQEVHDDNDTKEYYACHIRDILKTQNHIHAEYIYLLSKLYVKHKRPTACDYSMSLKNIDLYENTPEIIELQHL